MFVNARLRAHSGDGCGTAESSQLHQLVHTEAILTEELLINVLGLLLPEDHKHHSLQSAMFFCFCFSFFKPNYTTMRWKCLPKIFNGLGHGGRCSATQTVLLSQVSCCGQRTCPGLSEDSPDSWCHQEADPKQSPHAQHPDGSRLLTQGKAEQDKKKKKKNSTRISRRVKLRQVAAEELLLY